MKDISGISLDVLRYLLSEMGYDLAFEMYKILLEKFPIAEDTKLLVIDFSRIQKAEMNADGTPKIPKGQTGYVEQIVFQKVELADERYPMENRGWTFYMGYSEVKDALIVKAAGLQRNH